MLVAMLKSTSTIIKKPTDVRGFRNAEWENYHVLRWKNLSTVEEENTPNVSGKIYG